MAKRKRLTPAQNDYLDTETPVLETKSFGLGNTVGRAPIAQVAGDASAAAALQDLADEVRRAKDEGRMILTLQEAKIDAEYLVRDRMMADEEELQVLMESLRARGQQTPVEVVELPNGDYGLISGWRRLCALRRLASESGGARFARVQAILRRPETAADAYVAMVEENEIRVGLSYYERARVAAKAVEQGVYDTEKSALLQLFSTASRAKRSKIRSFLPIYHAADDLLHHAPAINERLGLALAKALEQDGAADALRQALAAANAADAGAEIAVLEKIAAGEKTLIRKSESNSRPKQIAETVPDSGSDAAPDPDIKVDFDGHCVMLSGAGVTRAFHARLLEWLEFQT